MRITITLLLVPVLLGTWVADARADFDVGQQAFDRGDFAAARLVWRPLAQKGDPRAQYGLGRLLLTGADMEGLRWIRVSAEAAYLPAQLRMGVLHSLGMYVPADRSRAAAWLEKALEHGREVESAHRAEAAAARLILAMHWLRGGDAPDYDAVAPLIRKAADAGLPNAQLAYAQLLEGGQGVERDLIEAHKYYVLCAQQQEQRGVTQWAAEGAGRVRQLLPKAQFEQARKRLDAWIAAKDAGQLGWVYDYERRMSKGRRELATRTRISLHIYRTLALELSDGAAVRDPCWLRSRTVAGPREPGTGGWTERWTLDHAGKPHEFAVGFHRNKGRLRWLIQGPAAQGAKNPEALVARTCILAQAEDADGLARMIAPDERPWMSLNVIEFSQLMRGYLTMGAAKGGLADDVAARVALLDKTIAAVMKTHRLSLGRLRKSPAPAAREDAAAVAAWWRKMAPDLDHTEFITDMLRARIDLAEKKVGPRVTAEFEPYCGDLVRVKVTGDRARGQVGTMEVHFRRVNGRWFLSLAAGTRPATQSGWDDEEDGQAAAAAPSPSFDQGVTAHGRGDYARARAAWKPLAERGGRESQLRLGGLYERGQGVEKDLAEAHKWYVLAWKRSLDAARAKALAVRKRMTEAQMEDSRKRIRSWIRDMQRPAAKGSRPLFPIFERGKWGFIDATGNVIVPARYDDCTIARVMWEGADPATIQCERLRNDQWPTLDEMIGVKLGGRWGYVGRDGGIPPTFDHVGPFADGLGPVVHNKKAGFVDRSGAVVIPMRFDGVGWFDGGVAPVLVGKKWGLIDRKGAYVLAPRFDFIYPDSLTPERPGVFKVSQGKKFGIVRADGRVLVPPRFDEIRTVSEGWVNVKVNRKWGYVDAKTGAIAIEPTFDYAHGFESGFASAGLNDRYGYIDRKGHFTDAPPARFPLLYHFHGSLMIFSQGPHAGILDARIGKIVVEAKYDSISHVQDGRASFRQGNAFGYLDEKGAVVIEPRFESAQSFREGLAAVSVGRGKFGYIDKTGVMVIKPHLKRPHPFRKDLALVVDQDRRRFRYMNRDGQTVYSFPRPCPRSLVTWDSR